MKPILISTLLLGLSTAGFSSTFNVRVLGTTSTQAILAYEAPDSNACTVSVSQNAALAPLVHDVDPNLFSGANLDTRSGNVVNGAARTIVVGARATGDASDGNVYSRALQANTTHYFQISCDSGAATGSGTFTTTNLTLGNSAPDPIGHDAGAWNGWGWPTLYDVPETTHIDPQTGLLVAQWTKPGDSGGQINNIPVYQAYDLAGAWTNPQNITGAADANYASTSAAGQSNALFLLPGGLESFGASFVPSSYQGTDDARLHINGYVSTSDTIVSACLTYMGFGGVCLGSPVTVPLPVGSANAADTVAPSNFPAPLFQGWGNAKVTPDMIADTLVGTIGSITGSSAGSTITWGASNYKGNNLTFPVTILQPGMKMQLSGTAPTCPNNLCTIQSVINEQQIVVAQNLSGWNGSSTTVSGAVSAGASSFTVASAAGFIPWLGNGEFANMTVGGNSGVVCMALSGNTFSQCSGISSAVANGASAGQNQYGFPNFGFLVWKSAGSGSVYITSSSSDWATSNNFFTGYQGSDRPYCSAQTVTTNVTASGAALSTPLAGYTCMLEDQFANFILYFIAPSTGEARKISNLENLGQPIPGNTATDWYVYNTSSQVMQHITYTGNYAAWSDNYNYDGNALAPTMSVTSLASSPNTIPQEIAAAYPNIDQTYFGAPQLLNGVYPLFMFAFQAGQGQLAWFCNVDVSQPAGASQVKYCWNSWSTYPVRWFGSHGLGYLENSNYAFMDSLSPLNSSGQQGIEQWSMAINTVYNNGGATALTSSFTDSTLNSVCPVANQCIRINVATDPVSTSPASGDLKPLGSLAAGSRPAPWAHNASSCGGDGTTSNCWSYLESIQAGDSIMDSAQAEYGEAFQVISRTVLGNGTIDLVLERNTNPFGCQSSSSPSAHSAGWVALAWPPQTCSTGNVWLPVASTIAAATIDNPNVYLGHTTTWFAPQGNQFHITAYGWNYDNAGGGYGAGYGIRNGTFPGFVGQMFNYGVQSQYGFAGDFHGLSINQIQSHPGGITTSAPMRESNWGVDGRPLGGIGGGNQYLWNQNLTLVSGQSHTYQISLPLQNDGATPISFAGWDVTLKRKLRQTFAFAGYHYLLDISGPGSVISDATPWTYCVADFAGECVSGSAQYNVYVSVPAASSSGLCNEDGTVNGPCFASGGPEIGGYTQFDISSDDRPGLRWRKLTMMFGGPGRTDNYANMHALATGDWGVSAVKWGDGRRSDVFGVMLPPWPHLDSTARNTFVSVPVKLGGEAGSTVRIRFGYGPNLYCSTRAEQCSTAVANSDPYAWLSETQSWTNCATGCTVTIPAAANRVLYYVVDRMNASGTVVSGPITITAVN